MLYLTPESFVDYQYREKKDFYHQIILRIVQTNYFNLIAKLKIDTDGIDDTQNKSSATFSSIHKGKVILLSYASTRPTYDTFALFN